jgi:sialidase-1
MPLPVPASRFDEEFIKRVDAANLKLYLTRGTSVSNYFLSLLPVAILSLPLASQLHADEIDIAGREPHGVATQTLWKAGNDGYHTYRIPSLLVTPKGTALAFCEGRKNSRADTGEIHLLLKRSTDGGKTWSPTKLVWKDGPNTCGNPCPVVDEETGTIWLLMTHNIGSDHERDITPGKAKGTRTVWVSHSTDDGLTWAAPTDITATTKKPEWTWYATGPGVGIQKRLGPHRGRLVIPCDHKLDAENYFSHVIYSDDHGKTWQMGGVVPQPRFNECQVIELTDGRLLLNMRNFIDKKKKPRPDRYRGISYSGDGGETWTEGKPDMALPEPICQGSIIRWRPADEASKPWVLHSNPADLTKRQNLTIRLSKDDGKTWPVSKTLYPGSAAYSCLTALPDGSFACLHEADVCKRLVFARFTHAWLEEGDASSPPADKGGSEKE